MQPTPRPSICWCAPARRPLGAISPDPLKIDGRHACTYVADFKVSVPEGTTQLHEAKGYEAPVWKLKRKPLAALHPDLALRVIHAGHGGHKHANRRRG
jgi:hypothetical protein